jgi:DNA-binding beta-propeller fold protein YncE
VSYSGGGLNAPTGVGVDSKGYIWVSSLNSVVSKFTPTGSAAFAGGITGSGISTPWGLAIDSADNVWIANEYSASSVNGGYGSITVLNTNGQAVSPSTGYTSGGLKYPLAVAIDPLNGNVWVVNYSNSRVSLLSSSGAPLSGTTGYGANSMAFIVAVAIDGNRNAWVGGQNDAMITQISPNISSGNAADNSSSSGVSCCNGPQNIATDQNGYVWIANFYGNSISQVSASGTVISPGYSGGAINQPRAIAVDGAGNVWAANYRSASSTGSPTLAQLAGAKASLPGSILSPATGYLTDAKLIQPYSMAIDASGNLWITNFDGGTATSSNTITQVIGMAVPIKTPLIGTPQTP